MRRICSLLLLVLVSGHLFGQMSCYNATRDKGISFYNRGRYDDAIKAFTTAKSCPDKPSSNDLDAWIKKCNSTISEKKKKEEERKRILEEERNAIFSISPSSVEMDASGGLKTFTISSSRSWYIDTNTNSWGHLTKQGNTLTLRLDANSGSSSRMDYFKIKSGSKSLRVNISQKGGSANSNTSLGNSAICIYDGGYFICDGKQWYEYRPKDKPNTIWATYSQSTEDDNFYYIKSSVSEVCVPKSSDSKVYIARNGKWEVVYNTTQVFKFCPQRGSKLFCHTTGFFFKDGDKWTSYLPEKNNKSIWNAYVQYSSDNDFYYLKNSQCEVAVPRKSSNKFFIRISADSKWNEIYSTTQVFDY